MNNAIPNLSRRSPGARAGSSRNSGGTVLQRSPDQVGTLSCKSFRFRDHAKKDCLLIGRWMIFRVTIAKESRPPSAVCLMGCPGSLKEIRRRLHMKRFGSVRSTRCLTNWDVGRRGQKHGRGRPVLLRLLALVVCLRTQSKTQEIDQKLTTQIDMRLLL